MDGRSVSEVRHGADPSLCIFSRPVSCKEIRRLKYTLLAVVYQALKLGLSKGTTDFENKLLRKGKSHDGLMEKITWRNFVFCPSPRGN